MLQAAMLFNRPIMSMFSANVATGFNYAVRVLKSVTLFYCKQN